MSNLLLQMATTISHGVWVAPFLAFVAGILTSLTPCSLSTVPLVIGYVGGYQEDHPKRAFRMSVMFAIGMTIIYI